MATTNGNGHSRITLNEDQFQRLERRFWARVNKDGPVHPLFGQCWVWVGRLRKDGYGELRVSGPITLAHRCSWMLHRGPIANGLCVLHRCDNRQCVNPDHLRLGTVADNNADCVAKNRQARGGRLSVTKLTPEMVREIKAKYQKWKCGARVLAEEYGVSLYTIYDVVTGYTWRHIDIMPTGSCRGES